MLIRYLPVFCLLRGGILYVRYYEMPNVTTRWREMVTAQSWTRCAHCKRKLRALQPRVGCAGLTYIGPYDSRELQFDSQDLHANKLA